MLALSLAFLMLSPSAVPSAAPSPTPAAKKAASTPTPAPMGASVERVYPKNVDAIIVLGLKKKRAGLSLASGFSSITANMSGTGTAGFSAVLFTVETWIQNLAADAAEKYLPFGREQLTDDDLVNAFRVVAYPDKPMRLQDQNLAQNVKHVVIRDAHRTTALQPEMTEPFDDSVGNAFGATVALTGMRAIFDWDKVEKIRAMDTKGEFLVTVVGQRSEKDFKVKTKHFDDLMISRK